MVSYAVVISSCGWAPVSLVRLVDVGHWRGRQFPPDSKKGDNSFFVIFSNGEFDPRSTFVPTGLDLKQGYVKRVDRPGSEATAAIPDPSVTLAVELTTVIVSTIPTKDDGASTSSPAVAQSRSLCRC